jgi:hypothetical protein
VEQIIIKTDSGHVAFSRYGDKIMIELVDTDGTDLKSELKNLFDNRDKVTMGDILDFFDYNMTFTADNFNDLRQKLATI